MRRLLLATAIALALPATAAAKGPLVSALCGPDECRDVGRLDVGPYGLFDTSKSQGPPPPAPYYELRLGFGGGNHSSGVYYEPRSGLVSYSEDFGFTAWAPLSTDSLEHAAEKVRPYPTPEVTAAWIGDRRVSGDPATYLRLVTLEGPFVAPEKPSDFAWIRLESPASNPWTSQALVYYPQDRVLLTRGATYVQVPAAIAADLAAARALGDAAGKTTLPWIAFGVALAGLLALGALRLSGSGGRAGRQTRPPAIRSSSPVDA